MGLSATLLTAQSSLATNAALSGIVGRNIAGVNDPNYSRKIGEVITNGSGGATLVGVNRAADEAVFRALLSSNADAASTKALSDGLNRLEDTVSLTNIAVNQDKTDSTTDTSPATSIAALASALQTYAAAPSQAATGQAVVAAAKAVATNLNQATKAVQAIRAQADISIGTAVTTINTLLGQFQPLNEAIMRGTATGSDITDLLDQRDALLKSLSGQIGVTTGTTTNNGMSIYTDSGATLFQGTPRTVTFQATNHFAAGSTGNGVVVDGVLVTGPSAAMPIKGGAINGLTQLRDTTTVAYQNHLDQTAQALINAFGETDQTGGGAPPIPGLFTAAGASATATTAPPGIAAAITVNANVDPMQGGTLTRLRDGGIGDPGNSAYVANPSGAASYSDHLTALLTSLDAPRSFDPSTGGLAAGSIKAYAESSVSWLETTRQSATADATNASAAAAAATTSLSSQTGVNLDDELSKMLDLEHSYTASAELMSTVKTMFDSLLSAVR